MVSGVNDLVLVQGMKDTRLTLRRWNERPLQVLAPWAALSLIVAVGLLVAVWLVAVLGPDRRHPPGDQWAHASRGAR